VKSEISQVRNFAGPRVRKKNAESFPSQIGYLATNAGRNKSVHENAHAPSCCVVSNHLILETKHYTCHTSTKYLLQKENLSNLAGLVYTYIKICYIHIYFTVFKRGNLLYWYYHGLKQWCQTRFSSGANSGKFNLKRAGPM